MSLAVTVSASQEAHWPSLSPKTRAAGSLSRAYVRYETTTLKPINPVKAKDVNGSYYGTATYAASRFICRVPINTINGLQMRLTLIAC
jgi:hypothetical protein